LLSPWVGNGWGIVCPPSIGDAVEVQFQEGHAGAGFVVGRFYSASDPPPGPCPAGEFWLVHQSGSFLKFTNDGNVEINAPTTTITGNLTVTGTLKTNGTLDLNTHTHGGVEPGGGDSGGPHN
jgi:phage baseplate assembly protein gpV